MLNRTRKLMRGIQRKRVVQRQKHKINCRRKAQFIIETYVSASN